MIYILLGPILLLTGTILLFYTYITVAKKQNSITHKSKPDKGNSKLKDKKKNHIIECEKCSKKLRVPTVSEVLNVTCPGCKHKFTHG